MTNNESSNIEGNFLQFLIGHSVFIFLMNGIKLKGTLTSYSEDILTLEYDGYTQMIYKHAISTIGLSAPANQ